MRKFNAAAILNSFYPESNNLPDGKTCVDCIFYKKCLGMFYCNEKSKECDWTPSKFKEEERILT